MRSYKNVPQIVTGLFVLWLLSALRPPSLQNAFDLNGFGQLPVLNGGRTKPLDTIARTSLLVLSGKQTLRVDGKTMSAGRWLVDVLFAPAKAAAYPVFEIDDPDVLGLMGIQQTNQRRFTFADLEPHSAEIEKQAAQADQIKPEQRSRFQSAVETLQSRITLYQKLQNTLQVAGSSTMTQSLQTFEAQSGPALKALRKARGKSSELRGPILRDVEMYRFLDGAAEFAPLPLPRASLRPNRWINIGAAVLARLQEDKYHPGVWAYAAMGDAWRNDDPVAFNEALHDYQTWLSGLVPGYQANARYEFIFNYAEPFYQSMILYLVVFLLAFFSWMAWPRTLNRSAFLSASTGSGRSHLRAFLAHDPAGPAARHEPLLLRHLRRLDGGRPRRGPREALPQRHREHGRFRDRVSYAHHRASSGDLRRHSGDDAGGPGLQFLARHARRLHYDRLQLDFPFRISGDYLYPAADLRQALG